ncbi:MAG: TIGR04086 family membrane protein [Chloroflexaceae bacterium]|jgi:putative membrane protein (TIGR04086 family)|nr:TIGR04086 family membrane protein [Chloroflexaceae bacterium]
MNIRWSVVLLGWLVDFSLSLLIQLAAILMSLTAFFEQPVLTRPADLILLVLLLLCTGIGGFIAGRLAQTDHAMHGLLVGVVGIIIGSMLNGGTATPLFFIVSQIVGCGVGALGGYLSSFVTRPLPRK